jgi:cytidine deaminase
VEIDWTALRTLAAETAERAHAPYSRLRVGVAGQASDGRVLVGCNVENASFGLTLCAECGLVSALHTSGGGTIVAVSVRTPDGHSLLPCGRCRQVLLEAGGPGLLVDTGSGPVELDRLLPSAFTGADLPGSGGDPPGSRAGLPGSGAGLPGSGDDLPSSRADLPDFRSDLPGPGDD